MLDAPVLVLDAGKVDPRVVDAETGGPDDDVVFARPAIGETDRAVCRANRARANVDAMPLELLVPSADHDVALRQPCAEARVESDPGDPEPRQPPPDIAPEGPLRKRGEPVTDGDVDVAGLGKLERDLTAGVCSPNDEDRALGKALAGLGTQRCAAGRCAGRAPRRFPG